MERNTWHGKTPDAVRCFTVHAAKVRNESGRTTGGTTSAGSASGLDPRFSTCTEAKAQGYGPYVRGQDPEYDWYIDRDGDGVVCE